jgi:hypothetical protein
MSVDPLQIAHDVEEELAHFNRFCPADARPSTLNKRGRETASSLSATSEDHA